MTTNPVSEIGCEIINGITCFLDKVGILFTSLGLWALHIQLSDGLMATGAISDFDMASAWDQIWVMYHCQWPLHSHNLSPNQEGSEKWWYSKLETFQDWRKSAPHIVTFEQPRCPTCCQHAVMSQYNSSWFLSHSRNSSYRSPTAMQAKKFRGDVWRELRYCTMLTSMFLHQQARGKTFSLSLTYRWEGRLWEGRL